MACNFPDVLFNRALNLFIFCLTLESWQIIFVAGSLPHFVGGLVKESRYLTPPPPPSPLPWLFTQWSLVPVPYDSVCVGGLGAWLLLCFSTRVTPLGLLWGLEAENSENMRLDYSGLCFSPRYPKDGLKSLYAAFDLFTAAAMRHHIKPEGLVSLKPVGCPV